MWFEESCISPDCKDLFSQKQQGCHSASWHYPCSVCPRDNASLPKSPSFLENSWGMSPKGRWRLWGLGGWAGRVRGGGQARWLCFPSGMATVRQPRSLGSAIACTAHSCRNAHCVSLLFQDEGGASSNLIPTLSGLRLTVSYGLPAPGCVPGTVSALFPSYLPGSLPLAHLQVINAWISQTC